MKTKGKTKKIYFTDDFTAENVEKLQNDGWILRNASAVKEGDFIETADEYGGDVPEHYQVKTNLGKGDPADLTGLVPTEQFDALALDLTNTKEQLATTQGEFIAFKNDVGSMQARIAELQSVDYSKLKIDELKDALKLKGIEFPSDAKKDDLLTLLTPKE